MEKNIAIISIIVDKGAETDKINALLHEFRDYVKGRLGVPEVNEGVSVICVVIDAPGDVINTVAGKIGMIKGVKAKTLVR
ncbi:MAG: TM1266 family iron-only hydrogenase system putative regulator [Candidatus Neoclostridium sp.]